MFPSVIEGAPESAFWPAPVGNRRARRRVPRAAGRGPPRHIRIAKGDMTYVVNESCIKCKLMDCVEVCPVDCFYEGANMLVIHPDECIDCGVCEPECPVEAILPDSEGDPRSVAKVEHRICGEMAEHHAQGQCPGGRGRHQGRGRQV